MRARGLGLLATALMVGACATEGTMRASSDAPAPSEARGPSPRARLAAAHRDRAVQLERDGALHQAVDELKVARTIDPADTAARDGQARLQAKIEGLIAQRLNEGRAALARGSHVEARRRFLMVLALDPANRTAVNLLQAEVRDVEFLTHTVRAGDTLGSLAERYYGDRSRSEVIWETNQLPPNPRLVAGTTLKIPEIPGLPFARPTPPRRDAPPPVAVVPSTPGAAPETPTRPEVREEVPPEVNPLMAEAREALDRRDYTLALGDIDKLLQGDPGNREAMSLKKQALYRQSKAQIDQKNYDASYRTLTTLARLEPNYEDVPKLLQQMRGRLVDQHYREGIRLYREERLPEAIKEWRLVLEVDPQHPNAKSNIEQAERLLRGLEQRKKK